MSQNTHNNRCICCGGDFANTIELSEELGKGRMCCGCFNDFHRKVEVIDQELAQKRIKLIKKAQKKVYPRNNDGCVTHIVVGIILLGLLFYWLIHNT